MYPVHHDLPARQRAAAGARDHNRQELGGSSHSLVTYRRELRSGGGGGADGPDGGVEGGEHGGGGGRTPLG